MKILITGSAGFIGYHLAKKLIERGDTIYGVDNLNSYYDVRLKKSRLKNLHIFSKSFQNKFKFSRFDLQNKKKLDRLFNKFKPEKVINLAAQAGVRYSIQEPSTYIQSNLVGFGNILEACRNNKVDHLIYASSSSVYGGNENLPFSEEDSVDHPVSLYAATKRSNELMAHTYSHLYGLSATGLRFFTVYGPWGRPDMALFLFTRSILNGRPIKVFNNGEMSRDFTYIDDVIEALTKLMDKKATSDNSFNKKNPNPATSWSPHRIFNIGNSTPINLINYIECLETELGKSSKKIFLPMQSGDVKETSSDCKNLEKWINYKPNTQIKEGIANFVKWYKDYYRI